MLPPSHYREAVVDNKKSSGDYGPENGVGADFYPINIHHSRMIAKNPALRPGLSWSDMPELRLPPPGTHIFVS
jgi:hypothetical protein